MIKRSHILSLSITTKPVVSDEELCYPVTITFRNKKDNGENIKSEILVPHSFKEKVLDVLFDDGKVFCLKNKTVYPGKAISHIILDKNPLCNKFPGRFELHLLGGGLGGCVLREEDYIKLVFSTR